MCRGRGRGRESTRKEIKSNREALQTAEKFLEYSRSKGNERHSLVLSKSTNLLQEIVRQNQKQATIQVNNPGAGQTIACLNEDHFSASNRHACKLILMHAAY